MEKVWVGINDVEKIQLILSVYLVIGPGRVF